MDISSLCRREVVTIRASASVREAAAAMRNQHVGALAVTDPYTPGRVLGVVTDRDIVVDLLALGHPVDQPIGSLCHTGPASIPAAASLTDAVQAMQHAGVRRLLVLGEDDSVTGLVSIDDLVEAVSGELDALAATLRDGVISEGSRERARARAESEPSPPPLYAVRHEP
ncbi:CBS domain-containing protein [Ramlibacter sp. MMS24-I3-19]|uniref:CBS domain-containing protein n=1 Tax=Ramlibacter sp. MMS24-I3-19 TaxID=3416606 RepID=UPI003D06BEB7